MQEIVNVKEPLSDDKKMSLYKELARFEEIKSVALSERAEINAAYNATVKEADKNISDIVSLLRNGFELEEVLCEVEYDNTTLTRTVKRLDTGREFEEPFDQPNLYGDADS